MWTDGLVAVHAFVAARRGRLEKAADLIGLLRALKQSEG